MKAKEFVRAKSLEEAYELLKANPMNKILGGGLWLKKGNMDLNTIIDLSLLGLNKIEEEEEYIRVGAMVTQGDFAKSELIKDVYH